VLRGQSLDDDLASQEAAQDIVAELSPRQKQILALRVQGYKCREVAKAMDIAEGTVKSYSWRIRQKLKLLRETA
jgi:RNA polymerase sigma factor (sigma-70 family)